MDVESYFALKDDITPGNVGFYKKSVTSAGDVPEEVRFRTKAKYPGSSLCGKQYQKKGSENHFLSLKKLC